jgi:2-methylcitrate dehydratase PrpD
MSQMDNVSQGIETMLVDHVARVRFEDLPRNVVEYCKLLVMDSFGVTFPGSTAPGCREVVELARAWGGSGSHVLLYGYEAAPPFVASANSTMMHALDFDDTLDDSALHTFVSVLPAGLATAEYIGKVDGKTLITALVLGVDMICRVSLGIHRPLSWIRTSTCGSFGSAVTAGKILGLDRDRLTNALGVVYSQTSGNAQGLIEGRLVKRMQPGFAAQAGVNSAFLSRAGITGSHNFLQGRYGFYNLYERGEYDPDPVIDGLGEHYTILDLSLKPYPCCRMTHASIDSAFQLRDVIGGSAIDVEEIRVTASKMVTEMVGKPFVIGTDPQVDAQFSIPYTVSAALLYGDVFLKDFEVAAIMEESVKALAERVKVTSDPNLPDKDILHAKMTIRMKNGQSHEASVNAPLGNPAKPLTIEHCKEKFRKCLTHSEVDFDAAKTTELLSMIEDLEQVRDVSLLTALMQIESTS